MNLILLFPEDFIPGTNRVRLSGRRQQHVLSIHKAQKGDELRVGVVNGRIGKGEIVRLDKAILEMDVTLKDAAPAALNVTLILALPRPPVLKRVLLSAASLGVKEIYLLNSYRVEKTFWKSHALGEDEVKEQLILGLEQAQDSLLPSVHLRPRFKPFVEDELPRLCKGTQAFVAHPQGGKRFPARIKGPVTLAVGPEGGFIPYEVERFLKAGFQAVHLGERILRVETAVPVLLGKFL